MVKKILRYSLLMMLALVLVAWGWSQFYYCEIKYQAKDQRDYALIILPGELWVGGFYSPRYHGFGESFELKRISTDLLSLERWGFRGLPSYMVRQKVSGEALPEKEDHVFIIPYWFLFILLAIPLMLAWYRPMRNWWREKRKAVGFEVEMKNEKKE